MSIRALNWAWEQATGNPTAKATLAALADLADEAHSCWPSIDFLAERVEVSGRTISRTLNDLERAGYFHRERRYAGYGKRTTDRYVLHVGQEIVSVAPLGDKLASNEELTKTPDQTLGDKLASNEETDPSLGDNCGVYIENPEKIDKSIFIEGEPEADAAMRPDDDSVSRVDARLKRIHPSLSTAEVVSRLRRADPSEVDVLLAAQVVLGRASRPVANPAAFVAAAIDKTPLAWQNTTSAFQPGDDVSGIVPARELRRDRAARERAACARGEHDWGPTIWPEFDRAHCLRDGCGVRRRTVDPEFAAAEDSEFESGVSS